MKNNPIESHIVCNCCPKPQNILKDFCRNAFGSVTLNIASYDVVNKCTAEVLSIPLTKYNDDYFVFTSTKAVNKLFKELLKDCESAEIFIDSPLHDETYEYNKVTGDWILTKQGMGFA